MIEGTGRIVFDAKLMRPACVLLQASMGGNSRLAHAFEAQDWLTAPTPDMRCYPVNAEQLEKLVKMVKEHRK